MGSLWISTRDHSWSHKRAKNTTTSCVPSFFCPRDRNTSEVVVHSLRFIFPATTVRNLTTPPTGRNIRRIPRDFFFSLGLRATFWVVISEASQKLDGSRRCERCRYYSHDHYHYHYHYDCRRCGRCRTARASTASASRS